MISTALVTVGVDHKGFICMQLITLFDKFPLPVYTPVPDVSIAGLAFDSRRVQQGDLFIALSGAPTDGHVYIPDAIARGAAAIIGVESIEGLPVPYIRVSDSRQALAHIAAAWHDFPARKLTMIGVTGTDGKTTTTSLIFSILKAAGMRAGMVSTVSAVIGDRELDTGFHVTTPDAPDVQRFMAEMVAAGLTHAVIETTSHGLAQYRVDACNFVVSAVTNITHEHLNFHGSFEAYRAAKARLIEMLPSSGCAILNRDDSSYEFLERVCGQRPMIQYGFHTDADLRPLAVTYTPGGLRFTITGAGQHFPVESPLVGDFNISNILAAVGATVCALGISTEAARQGITAMSGVPGRMERIDLGQDFTAIVDFAHTPNALRVALETVRKMGTTSSGTPRGVAGAKTAGRVIAVFGSAGARDITKRRLMAEVAAELADISILTAEDPRTESLEGILAEMAAGAESRHGVEGQTFYRIPDRGEAIRFAVSLARPGDVVIACGKGHEQSMCFGETEYPWDDRVAMRAALSKLLGKSGPLMPYLPTS
jgi:UDP-N-acetylmuramoyl-L-alanyl-D-glutamate--2,6-diaminopimelate ligase